MLPDMEAYRLHTASVRRPGKGNETMTTHHQQREQARQLLKSRGIDRALLGHPASITWLTGFAVPQRPAIDLYMGGPPLVWYEDGHHTLIMVEAQAALASHLAGEPDCEVVTYQGYNLDQLPDPPARLAEVLQTLGVGSAAGTVGIETASVPVRAWQTLPGNGDLTPIDGWLRPLRMIKTEAELDKLRACFRLSDVAQAAARAAVQPGHCELDVWTAAHRALQLAAGQTLPLGNDCNVGRRAHEGGPGTSVEIEPGDSVVVDLGTCLDGYWSDSCGTYYAGTPTDRQRSLHQTASEALNLAISLVKPGAVAGEIDAAVRAFIEQAGYPVYPHHTGHGIGTQAHELPFITPYSRDTLQPGMTLLLEPGIYFPGETGIRLEHAVLVTADGAEVLTQFDQGL
jgi:Xaa-Pro dipeptidase